MRLFLVAAAFCSISQLAWAFDYDLCEKVKLDSLFWYETSNETMETAITAIGIDPSKTDDSAKRLYDKILKRADDQVKRSSDYANIYQAFCKD